MGKYASSTRSTARGQVTRVGGTWMASVVDSTGKVVWSDNTGGRNARVSMLNEASEVVAAVRRIENAGHRLALSWTEVVDSCKRSF